jgi:hypothetical protein
LSSSSNSLFFLPTALSQPKAAHTISHWLERVCRDLDQDSQAAEDFGRADSWPNAQNYRRTHPFGKENSSTKNPEPA